MAPKRKEPPEHPLPPPLFAGCRVVFWAGRSREILKKRMLEMGAVLQPKIVVGGAPDATTHVVCPHKPQMSAPCIAKKLRDEYKGPTEELRAGDGTLVRMPPGVTFVCDDWGSTSIAKACLQPVAPYLPPCLQPAPEKPAAAKAAVEREDTPDRGLTPAGPSGSGQAAAPAAPKPAPPEPQPAFSVETAALDQEERSQAGQEVDQPPPAEDASRARAAWPRGQSVPAEPTPAVHCKVVRRGPDFVVVEGVKPQYTGGLTGIPWGTAGVWDEPYDPEAARETSTNLRNFWYSWKRPEKEQKKGEKGKQNGSKPASQQPPAPRPKTNGVCPHAACSLRDFCICAKLNHFKDTVYSKGRGVDNFKMKAIDKAVQILMSWPEPLDTAEDVARVRKGDKPLAEKSAQKVVEILATGSSARVQQAEESEEFQVLRLFMEVWGAGDFVARRWYEAGCRTLDDVRARGPELSLTEQQRVFLRYASDLQRKIPRAEVARAERRAREACFDLVERHGAADVEFTFCSATGGFRRGKSESHDIDILVCLPPSLQGSDACVFLSEFLNLLILRGMVLDEMNPRKPPAEHQVVDEDCMSATFLGVCRVDPGGPVRRIDFKVYNHSHKAFALAYFGSSQAFCRAIRHWSNHAVPEQAKPFHPEATGFKLSDRDIVPTRRDRKRRWRGPWRKNWKPRGWAKPTSKRWSDDEDEEGGQRERLDAQAEGEEGEEEEEGETSEESDEMEGPDHHHQQLQQHAVGSGGPGNGGGGGGSLGTQAGLGPASGGSLGTQRGPASGGSWQGGSQAGPGAPAFGSPGSQAFGSQAFGSPGGRMPMGAAPRWWRKVQEKRREGTHILGPPVPCATETDIFRLLGISYVPSSMRYFDDQESAGGALVVWPPRK